ncbi:ferric reductase-like transmembrane domain-containing protein [Hydrotalea sp.]|uniref:ferric reductase-like transmembrane domain-containing protein n=1 Tax=Hydrotalea sp. TaxID=2881279 RepID=UPI002588ACEA|nr:ferric reductase-like transmembrane domain-containing protein [Hydrotalea sp.]
MQTIDISGTIGLIATAVLTLNILLGMLLSSAYKKSVYWKCVPAFIQKLNITDIHNYTAYLALLLVLVHIVLIPIDSASKFSWLQLLWSLNTQHQPYMALLGSLSFYALILVIITTQKIIKNKMRFRFWKNVHLISYGTALLFIIHGIWMDPELKDRPVDFLDAEKLLSEICGLVLIAASVIRFRYFIRKQC